MKTITTLCLVFSLTALWSVDAQVKDPKEEAKKEGEKRTNEKIDENIDKGFNKIEEGLGGLFGKKKKKKSKDEPKISESTGAEVESDASDMETTSPKLNWAKYDFVPGDKVIFEDNLLDEENGEFPSRWDLVRGVAEVAEFDGANVIMMREGSPNIVPYLKDASVDYLPDVFTIEFDVFMGGTSGWLNMFLYDAKNQRKPSGNETKLIIYPNKMEVFRANSEYPDKDIQRNRWVHVAVAFTNGKFKAYMDDTRLINIPRLDINPTGISMYCYHASDANPIYIKNIRIAEGGVKYYDRILQDGKIVSNGIRFDVNKATLRPESMGVINEIYDLLNDHPELNFSIEGHTDSDGDEAFNLKLSEQRAASVKNKLIELGVSPDRLSTKGFGESVPVDNNFTAEGKANNRRVEFVKL